VAAKEDPATGRHVLADRMAERDPGTAPKVGDRIQYVYVEGSKKGAKQGDRIEHVDYVKAKKLKVDTTHYITNQIQNPVAQLFALCIDQLDGYAPPRSPSYADLYAKFMDKLNNEEEATLAVLDKKEKQLESLLFLESPDIKKVVYKIDLKRVINRKLVMGIADGVLEADGEVIYTCNDMRVGLFGAAKDEQAGA
jgi:hypothetical protein